MFNHPTRALFLLAAAFFTVTLELPWTDRIPGLKTAREALFQTLNYRWVLLALALASTSLGVMLRWVDTTLRWLTSQFFFSYQELGFVSRGLVASVLEPFPILLSRPGLLMVTLGILIAFAVTWSNLFFRCTKYFGVKDRATLALVFILSPSTFLHLGFDYGRFDPLNLIIAILAIRCLQRSRDLLAALLATTAVLVHEGFLLIHFPLLCAYLLTREGSHRTRLVRLAQFVLLPGIATIAILGWGRYEPGIDALTAHFEANAFYRAATPDGAVNRDAILVIVRTFKDNLEFNISQFQATTWFDFALGGGWFLIFALFYDGLFRRNALPRGYLYYSAFGPLLLSFLACDYFRWIALATINMFIVFLLTAESRGKYGEPIVVPWNWIAKTIAVSCLLGPISANAAFPWFSKLLDHFWMP